MNAQTKVTGETLSSAMALAFAEIEAATKGSENEAFKRNGKASKYADLGAVIDAIKPALVNHGLFFTQHCHPDENGVMVETVLGHASGEEKSLGRLFVPANKKDAHGFGSALSYARRYSLMTAFAVPTEDDDGNAASRSVANEQKAGDEKKASEDPLREPAARTVLEGLHTSKTALRKAILDVVAKVSAAMSNEEIDNIMRENAETVRQANRDWPTLLNGDPRIPEDIGLRGVVAERRQLVADDGQFKMLVDSMKSCTTPKQLDNWRIANDTIIAELDGAESRKFQLAYELHESALHQVATVNAG